MFNFNTYNLKTIKISTRKEILYVYNYMIFHLYTMVDLMSSELHSRKVRSFYFGSVWDLYWIKTFIILIASVIPRVIQ